MILPEGHWQAVSGPRRLLYREKWIIGTASGLLLIALAAFAISLATAGRSSGNGCVSVTVQYVTGGTQLYRCGAQARALCSSTTQTNGSNRAFERAVASECRKAGLPVSGQ